MQNTQKLNYLMFIKYPLNTEVVKLLIDLVNCDLVWWRNYKYACGGGGSKPFYSHR